jgi:RluA family pseudouridine synthase
MDILFADPAILIVNKPANVATIPGGWNTDSSSLVRTLESTFGRIWVVHRLDKVTSGVVVFARNAEIHRALNTLFEKREIHKIYHAIIIGSPTWDEHIARHPLRSNVGHSHRTIVDPEKGKPAETFFQILERFDNFTLLQAIPRTGRTHQIRVHAYALGFPLVADKLYGAPESDLIRRPALHAYSIAFTHPQTGEQVSFSAPYPQDFEILQQSLRKKKAG